MNWLFMPLTRAVQQLDDPVFQGVLWRSIACAALCFALLVAGAVWAVHHWLSGWHVWAADLLTGIGSALLAFWLFLPVAAAIGGLFMERIAQAVEWRWYPDLPPPRGERLSLQIWDGIAVGLRILLFNIVALVLALIIPGIGIFLGWAIAAWAIARGMFVAVAMRRTTRAQAEALYQRDKLIILAQGGVLALAAWIPLLNLLLPVLGTAVMVHILDQALQGGFLNRLSSRI
ncbi:MAG: EI24 domain-containing protein [Acetobacteraceae bacterium]|nr:EI24 domain-containing protein [Acetobacteraceae bacterium]